MVGFASSPRFVDHAPDANHPERPDRIRAIHRAVRLAGLVTSDDPFPDFKIDLNIAKSNCPPLVEIDPTHARLNAIERAHPRLLIDRIAKKCEQSEYLDAGDTPTCPATYDTALLSAGCAMAAADAVMTGIVKRCFSAARPPGHHAEFSRPMGFCVFNNVAIAARHIQQDYNIERVAIVDFDVHHGNGTQEIFEDDPTVHFTSIHQHPDTCYPGTGYDYEVGTDAGRGYTLNVPMRPGSNDEDYARAFDTKIIPALDRFKPQVLLISAGFDAHADDALDETAIRLTDDAFEMMTSKLCAIADTHCQGRVVSILEGGYDLRALGRCVVRHLETLCRTLK